MNYNKYSDKSKKKRKIRKLNDKILKEISEKIGIYTIPYKIKKEKNYNEYI